MSGSSSKSRRPARQFRPEPFAYHQELTLQIETLTNLAHGIARVDGWVVMVPFALPGEKVVARVHANFKTYSEADLVRVLEPSPHRITPPCPLFGTCGGCQYQNFTYEQQLVWKQRQIGELLQRMARIEFPVELVTPSPRQFGYRSKITPHFGRPRDGKIEAIGFLEQGSRFRIVDVPRCEIAMPEINERLPELREGIRARAHQFKNGSTLLLRVSQGRVLTQSSDPAVETVGPLELEFLAGDFFQNNPFILPALVDHVAAQASAGGARFLIDAYCGSGLFALCCASRFEQVTGIEISESAGAPCRGECGPQWHLQLPLYRRERRAHLPWHQLRCLTDRGHRGSAARGMQRGFPEPTLRLWSGHRRLCLLQSAHPNARPGEVRRERLRPAKGSALRSLSPDPSPGVRDDAHQNQRILNPHVPECDRDPVHQIRDLRVRGFQSFDGGHQPAGSFLRLVVFRVFFAFLLLIRGLSLQEFRLLEQFGTGRVG